MRVSNRQSLYDPFFISGVGYVASNLCLTQHVHIEVIIVIPLLHTSAFGRL